jgi:hypothetical protein
MLSAIGGSAPHHKGGPVTGCLSPGCLSLADLARGVPIRQWTDGHDSMQKVMLNLDQHPITQVARRQGGRSQLFGFKRGRLNRRG